MGRVARLPPNGGSVNTTKVLTVAKTSRALRGPPPGRTTGNGLAGRDGLVVEHLGLAKAIAVSMHEKLPVHVDLDDLVQAGVVGLIDAASKFDAGRQIDFSSYAKHRIRGAILDSLRQLDWASRDLRRKQKQVERVMRDLAGTLQRAPTEAEVAGKLGMDVDHWRAMKLGLENIGPISASRLNQFDDLPAPEFPSKPGTQPDFIFARRELRSMLGEVIGVLPARHGQVIQLYYVKQLTMKEIGELLGVNESRVSQVHKAALEKMAKLLGDHGVHSMHAIQD